MNRASEPAAAVAAGAGQSDWWRGAAIYQIYPRSFQDSNGDGIGDLPGITGRLGHVADLGADAIWISPFFPSPMKDFGYDVSDYQDVDPIFGTLADFDALVAEAHRLGLRVIIDQVISHSSDRHPWFAESRSSRDNPKADWYVWADSQPDGSPPNNWISIFGGSAWQWDTARNQYYLHNFLAEQPDFNFHNPAVQRALLETMRFWLERGVDGFRLDTVNFYFHSAGLQINPPNARFADDPNPYNRQHHQFDKNQPDNLDFLRRMRVLLDEYGAMTVGEVGETERSIELMAAYSSGGDKLQMCYSFEFLSEHFSPGHFRSNIEAFEQQAPDGWPCWAFSNHDVARHVSRWAADEASRTSVARLAASLLLSLRGTLCIYQGEELGLPEAELRYEDLQDPVGIRFWPKLKGRDGCRTPMVWQVQAPEGGFTEGKPWLPIPEEHKSMALDRQTGDDEALLAHYRLMLAFRTGEEALRLGSITFLDAPGGVLAFRRGISGSGLLCAFNLTGNEVHWPMAAAVHGEPANADLCDGQAEGDCLTLPPYGAWFGQQSG